MTSSRECMARMTQCFAEASMNNRTLKMYHIKKSTGLPIMTVYRYLEKMKQTKMIRVAKTVRFRRTGLPSKEYVLTDLGKLMALIDRMIDNENILKWLRKDMTDAKFMKVADELRELGVLPS